MNHHGPDRPQLITSKPVSSLRDAALAPTTLRQYNNNLRKLLTYTRLSLKQLLSLRPSKIDRLLAEWIEHLYRCHGSFDYASQALNGLVFHSPILRLKLHHSRTVLRGWSRIRDTRSHPPITWEVTIMFAVTMASWGYHAESVGVLLAFDCLLRVGELTRLVVSDIIRKNDPRVGSAHPTMAVRLRHTKTGKNQWVSLNNPIVASVLDNFLRTQSLQSEDQVFSFSPGQFNRLLHSVASALHVDHIPYVAHSFRHGGATCAYLSGSTIEQIVHRGRWRRLESARRYIQAGPALMASWTIPAALNRDGRIINQNLIDVMTFLQQTVPWHRRQQRQVQFEA